jgi:hypothetical protein
MSMSKKDFIALADAIKATKPDLKYDASQVYERYGIAYRDYVVFRPVRK